MEQLRIKNYQRTLKDFYRLENFYTLENVVQKIWFFSFIYYYWSSFLTVFKMAVDRTINQAQVAESE